MFKSNSKSTPPAKPVNKSAKPTKPTTPSSRVDTLIGKQTELLGDIRFSGGLHVDGTIKGKVLSSSDKGAVLSVSESGMVEGDVRVPHVVLNGTVTGDVHATERLQLSEKARVTGNVYYKIIEMASGAAVNGQMVHEGAEYLEHVGDAKPGGGERAKQGKGGGNAQGNQRGDMVTERNPVAKVS